MAHETPTTNPLTQPDGTTPSSLWPALVPALRCPIGAEPMRVEGRALVCSAGHSFDLARAGYVNLLTTSRAAAHRPGDAPEMLRARERFLASGAYHPLADALATVVSDYLTREAAAQVPTGEALLVVDVGCGTGYYLAMVGERLRAEGLGQTRLLGIDAAPDAARLTARRLTQDALRGSALVADLWRGLPLHDGAVAVLLDIFAPRNPAEFARVLAPGGLLLIVIPQSGHLRELRSVVPLLAVEEAKEEHAVERLSPDFSLLTARPIAAEMTLAGPALRDLVAMTPTARHLHPEELDAIEGQAATTVSLACTLLTLQRR